MGEGSDIALPYSHSEDDVIDTTVVPEYWDIEIGTLAYMLANGKWAAHEIAHIERQIEDRKAQILGGLGSPAQKAWTLRVQLEIDQRCRVRRDPIHGWMLDRLIDDPPCWHPVGYIGSGGHLETVDGVDEHGNRVQITHVTDDVVRQDLIMFLHRCDMQRPGYFVEKAAKSAAIRLENEKNATTRVLAAVDSMSDKRLKEFLSVEKAIQTGETVTMHGETMRQFEAMTEAGKKAPEGPQSLNPGVHPLKHRRDYSKGEGEAYATEQP